MTICRFLFLFLFKLLITFSLYASLVISHRNIYNAENQLKETPVYLWLYRILVNNGLAYYATWVTLASLLNFSIALTYSSGGNLMQFNISLIQVFLISYFKPYLS
jgi:hypothetical protein